jgi:nucleoid-associated protein YgaU
VADQGEIAQALQGAGVNVSNLSVRDVGGMTAVFGNVSSTDEKEKAGRALQEKVGKISNHIEVAGGGSDRTYTVKAGDSLSKIAQQFYGDASQWKKIHAANMDQIKDPDKIQPGWTLRIP